MEEAQEERGRGGQGQEQEQEGGDLPILYWGPESPFAQWYMHEFHVDGQRYNCLQQYVMAEKARLFGDVYARWNILHTDDPKMQKFLGGSIAGFDPLVWKRYSMDIVRIGNYAKFTQHEDLTETLLATGDRVIAEASPHDRVWGIGMSMDDPAMKEIWANRGANSSSGYRTPWPGLNLSGKAIMDVRARIRAEQRQE